MNKFQSWLITIVVVAAGLAYGADHLGLIDHGDNPPVVVLTAKQIGKLSRVSFAKTHAQAIREAAIEIERPDGDMAKAKAAFSARWQELRETAFDKASAPALDEIIAPGTDKPTASQRKHYAEFLRAIATEEENVK